MGSTIVTFRRTMLRHVWWPDMRHCAEPRGQASEHAEPACWAGPDHGAASWNSMGKGKGDGGLRVGGQ